MHLLAAENVLSLRGGGHDRGTAPAPDLGRDHRNYTDTHGASIVGFAFTYLLNFRLLPRLKNIGKALEEPAWATRLTEEDRRGLSPLFWTQVNPYGKFSLDMERHLDLGLSGRVSD